MSAINLGKERVLIFGGYNQKDSKEIQLVDLSFECFMSKNGKSNYLMKKGGKTYFPPFFD